MAPIQEGSQSIPPQAFERWNDPRGAALLALNRDGTVFCQGVRFGDGTEQTTAGGTGIDVVAYGADPSGVNDSTSAIQAALNAVPVGGGTVYFPAGSYIISSTLQVSISGTVLQGIGTGSTTANGSRIVAASGLVTPLLQISGASSNSLINVIQVQNLTLQGVYTSTQKGVYCDNYDNLLFQNVQFVNLGIAEDLDYGFRVVHYSCNYATSGSGDTAATATVRIANRTNTGGPPSEQFVFTNCLWEGDQTNQTKQGLGLYVGPFATSVLLSGCKFDYTNSSFAARVIALYQTAQFLIANSLIASGSVTDPPTASAVIDIAGTSGTPTNSVSITGCFVGFANSTPGVHVDYGIAVSISQNVFAGLGSGTGIVVTANAQTVSSVANALHSNDAIWSNAGSSSSSCLTVPVNSVIPYNFFDALSIGSTYAEEGALRLANAALIAWRNAANNGDYFLELDSSNRLQTNATIYSNGGNVQGAALLALANGSPPSPGANGLSLSGLTAASASAGSATLPAAPVGFLVINLGGTLCKLPYYAA
jgi:hypothetical protein